MAKPTTPAILRDLEAAKKAQPKAVQHPPKQQNWVDAWLKKDAVKSNKEKNAHIKSMNKGVIK
jgi:hypothetical protein